MIEKGSLIETRRGMFRVIDTRTLFNPFTEKDETEYIIDDNGVKRKVYTSDVIAEVKSGTEIIDEDLFAGKSIDGDGLNYSTDPNVMA